MKKNTLRHIFTAFLLLVLCALFLALIQKESDTLSQTSTHTDDNKEYLLTFGSPEISNKKDMYFVEYTISEEDGLTTISESEVEVLRKCYIEEDCSTREYSGMTKSITEFYSNSVLKGDTLLLYGLRPAASPEVFGKVENSIFVIRKDMFTEIINPIESKMDEKYTVMRNSFFDKNPTISEHDYGDEKWIQQKQLMFTQAKNEIKNEESAEVIHDLSALKEVARNITLQLN